MSLKKLIVEIRYFVSLALLTLYVIAHYKRAWHPGWSLLMYATSVGDAGLVEQLVKRKRLRLYWRDPEGNDAFVHVINSCNFDVLRVMVAADIYEDHLQTVRDYAAVDMNGQAVRIVDQGLANLRWLKYGWQSVQKEQVGQQLVPTTPVDEVAVDVFSEDSQGSVPSSTMVS